MIGRLPDNTDFVLVEWHERYGKILRRVRNVARRIEQRVATVLGDEMALRTAPEQVRSSRLPRALGSDGSGR